jgi:hypothetical protein
VDPVLARIEYMRADHDRKRRLLSIIRSQKTADDSRYIMVQADVKGEDAEGSNNADAQDLHPKYDIEDDNINSEVFESQSGVLNSVGIPYVLKTSRLRR